MVSPAWPRPPAPGPDRESVWDLERVPMGQRGPVVTAQPVLGARLQLHDAVGELRKLVTQPIQLAHATTSLCPELRELLLVDRHVGSVLPSLVSLYGDYHSVIPVLNLVYQGSHPSL